MQNVGRKRVHRKRLNGKLKKRTKRAFTVAYTSPTKPSPVSIRLRHHIEGETYVDPRRERLADLLPLDLVCRGDEAVLWCPLICGQDDGLKRLHRLEPVLLAERVAVLHDELRNLRMCAQAVQIVVGVDALDGLLLEQLPQVLLVREDDRNGLLRVWCRVHAEVRDEVRALVDGFETLEGDVLKRSQNST